MAENGNHQLHPNAGHRGALMSSIILSISLVLTIINRLHTQKLLRQLKSLEQLWDAAAPITLVTICGIAVTTILEMAPEIFSRKDQDGTSFRCSDSYLWQWLHGTLLWSEQRATWVTQKLPDNWEQICEHAFLRIAYEIKEEDIPSKQFVNSDQTQVIYAQGSKLTWA